MRTAMGHLTFSSSQVFDSSRAQTPAPCRLGRMTELGKTPVNLVTMAAQQDKPLTLCSAHRGFVSHPILVLWPLVHYGSRPFAFLLTIGLAAVKLRRGQAEPREAQSSSIRDDARSPRKRLRDPRDNSARTGTSSPTWETNNPRGVATAQARLPPL